MRNDYTPITELPAALLTPDQVRRFAHRYGYAQTLARGKRTLEVACGAGGALDYLAQSAAHITGLDYTAGVLRVARQHTHAPLVRGDAQQLPFAAEQFDLILCFEALYYLEEYQRFLAECYRLLARGGTLLICQSNPDWPDFVPGALTTYYPSLPELATNLTVAGFSAVDAYGILPVTATGTRQRVINTLRRWVLRSGILPLLGPVKGVLQWMSYGQMVALPPMVGEKWIVTRQAGLTLNPLASTATDRIHRVIYVKATK